MRRLLDGPRPDDAIGAATCGAGVRTTPHAFVTDSLCCVSRSSLFTGQYPHQTGVRTNTSQRSGTPLGGWPAFDSNGNPERAFNVRAPAVGLHDRLRRQVPQRVRVGAGPRAPAGAAGLVEVQRRLRLRLRRLGLRLDLCQQRPAAGAPARSAAAVERDGQARPGLCRQRDRRPRDELHRPAPRPATRRTSSRSRSTRRTTAHSPRAYYPGDPLFPPMFRDRPTTASRATAAASPAAT